MQSRPNPGIKIVQSKSLKKILHLRNAVEIQRASEIESVSAKGQKVGQWPYKGRGVASWQKERLTPFFYFGKLFKIWLSTLYWHRHFWNITHRCKARSRLLNSLRRIPVFKPLLDCISAQCLLFRQQLVICPNIFVFLWWYLTTKISEKYSAAMYKATAHHRLCAGPLFAS